MILDLSIIIVNWNTRELLKDCLASIYSEHLDFIYEIIVVDNASTDGSIEMVEELYPKVKLTKNQQNSGFAAANNQAMVNSRGRYLFLLNPDTIVLKDAIPGLINFMDNHPFVGVVGPRLLSPDGTIQPSCQVFPTLLSTMLDASLILRFIPWKKWASRYDLRLWSHDEQRPVDWVTGAAMIVRHEVVEQVGYLDESFFMYSEESDWQYRIRKAGWEIYYVPNFEVIHYGGAAGEKLPGRMKATWTRSYVYFFRKNYGLVHAWLARLFLTLGFTLRILLWSVIFATRGKFKTLAKQRILQWRAGLIWCLTGRISE